MTGVQMPNSKNQGQMRPAARRRLASGSRGYRSPDAASRLTGRPFPRSRTEAYGHLFSVAPCISPAPWLRAHRKPCAGVHPSEEWPRHPSPPGRPDYRVHHGSSQGVPSWSPSILTPGQCLRKYSASAHEVIWMQRVRPSHLNAGFASTIASPRHRAALFGQRRAIAMPRPAPACAGLQPPTGANRHHPCRPAAAVVRHSVAPRWAPAFACRWGTDRLGRSPHHRRCT
jgi:hypothetical protein